MTQHLLSKEPTSPRFVALAQWVLAHPRLTLSVTLTLTLLSGLLALTRLEVNNSLEVFAPKEAEVMQSRARYQARFGRDDLFMVMARAEAPGGVFTHPYLTKLKALEEEIKGLSVDVTLKSAPREALEGVADAPQGALKELEGDEWGEEEGDAWGDEAEGSVVEQVTSLVSVRRTLNREGGVVVERWFEPLPSSDQALRELGVLALQDHQLKRRLVDDQAQLSVLLVRVALMSDGDLQRVYDALVELTQAHNTEGFKIRVTGPPAVNAALNQLVIGDLSRLLMLSGASMILALIWLFRRPLMVAGPMVVVAVSVLWTVGLMAALGMGLNLLSSILPAFLLCVGLGDSIHVQSIYKRLRQEGMSAQEAIPHACGLTGPPVLFTSLTTMIGLLSFHFATVTAVKEMGLAGGVGVMFALLHSLITLPIFLMWQGEADVSLKSGSAQQGDEHEQDNQGKQGELQEDSLDRVLKAMVRLSHSSRGRALTLAVSFVFALVAAWGVSRLEVWHDDLETLPDDQPIKAAVQEADKALGGVAAAQILIDAPTELGVKDLKVLKGLEALTAHLLAYETPEGERIVGHVISPIDVIKETRRALLTGDQPPQKAYALPTTQRGASELMNLFELQSPDELRQLATIDLRSSHLTMQVKWREATSYEGLIKHVERGIEEHLKGVAQVEPTGGIYLAYTIVSSLLNDLLTSFTGAFLIITLLMVFMLGSLKLGALAMIPNLAPILLMLGGLGLLGIPLDLNNLLIASIALGIAVDDTIHFLHHFQASYAHTGDREEALEAARVNAGRAMVSTSLLLGAGFIVYLFASTEAIQRFGVIIALTLLTALITDMILCPAILRLAYPASRVLKGAVR